MTNFCAPISSIVSRVS